MKKLILLFAVSLFSVTASANYCATVYQGEDFTGAELNLYSGDKLDNLNDYMLETEHYSDWDNRISSVVVAPKCKLVMFQYQEFGRGWDTDYRVGEVKRIRNKSEHKMKYVYDLHHFNNLASSLKCICK